MEAVVIGAGVSGLSCALRLQEEGFPTRIVTRQRASDTTSSVAAATWYPYGIEPTDRMSRWCLRTLETLYDLARLPDAGGLVTEVVELFDAPAPDPWWAGDVREFRRETRAGFADGHAARVPLVEPQAYLAYLERRFGELGGEIHYFPAGVEDLGRLAEPDRIVVNCSGLGARTLVDDDEMYPIRGQVVRVENPGLNQSILVERDRSQPTYVFVRRNDCILGGTAEANEWEMAIDPAVSADILARCRELEPRLSGVKVFGSAVGLRPARSRVRLELEPLEPPRCAVIHNYGHGGNGFTLSWGCAEEVLSLARELRS